MKKLLTFILYILFFFAMLMFFLPKQNLYYAAEKELQNYGIILSGERLHPHLASLQINDATLYAQGIESATINQIQISFFGLYNTIEMHDITLSKALKSFFPKKIEHLQLRYTLMHPLSVLADARGSFGEATLHFDLQSSHLVLELQPSVMMKQRFANTLKELHKNSKGGYTYEQTFK